MVIVVELIDWARLGAATTFYSSQGYLQTKAAWWAPFDTMMATCPEVSRLVQIPGHGFLVGSSEQSFLDLETQGLLDKGRFVACTPCFRNEPVLDDLHQIGFMKVELYCNDDVSDNALDNVISHAHSFMSGYLSGSRFLERVRTHQGWDLCVDGIEVGSYGRRTWRNHSWIYGTGLAEPRFSVVVAAKKSC